MAYKTKKRPRGRPLLEINQKLFEQACACFCTKKTICDILECNPITLTSWCYRIYGTDFAHARDKFKAHTKLSLRQKQYQVAMSGDSNKLKWLGKQELGQAEVTTSNNIEIEDLKAISQMLEISDEELDKFSEKNEIIFNEKGVEKDAEIND